MPPTGANIAVLVLKTELAAGSSYTYQLAVVWVGRWDDGGLGAAILLRYCLLFVVAVVVAGLFWLVSIYVCLPVLGCSVIVEARRSVTCSGCRPPAPTLPCYY